MMWLALCCTAMVACSSLAAAAPAPESLAPLDLVQMDPSTADDESLGYAVQSMGGHYAAGAPWLYLLADMPRDSQVASKGVAKRSRRSFSVNPAVDLLQRNALINYFDRLAQDNRSFLDRVGKRGNGIIIILMCVSRHGVKSNNGRVKRRMPSLSIDLPMSVLRQKLSLAKERKEHALRAAANRNFLDNIGKRGIQQWSMPARYY